MDLFDPQGNRKYLTAPERDRFRAAALQLDDNDVRTFALMLLHSGARISEVLQLQVKSIDFDARAVTFETLKKRRRGVFRQVPLSPEFLDAMNLTHDLRRRQRRRAQRTERIWPMSRATASRRIDELMTAADIHGPQASAKGLRHAFAIYALQKGVPLNMVSKWMGHSSLEVTAIYANAIGEEERAMASRLWE